MIENNIVSILCVRFDNKNTYGTGFYVSNNYILSTSHLFKNCKQIFCYINNKIKRCVIWKIIDFCDICVLYDFTGNESYLDLDMTDFDCYSNVSIYGKNNIYNNITHLQGTIIYTNYVSYVNIDSIATNIKISKGFSGSPIILRNKVIGIMTWFTNNENGNNLYLSGGPNSHIIKSIIDNDILYEKTYEANGLCLHDCIKNNIYESYGEIILHSTNEYFEKNDIIISINNIFIGFDHSSSKSIFLKEIKEKYFTILLLRHNIYKTICIENPLFKIKNI